MADEQWETPLFPLNVVLVPGMALPLHIFEPRYRQMTCDCLDSDVQVGIVLARPASEQGQEIYARVGTLARIVDYERLPDGRYNLLAVGTERFEVLELRHGRPYLSALVRRLPDEDERRTPARLMDLAGEARAALAEYLRHVLTIVGNADCEIAVPDEPVELSYVIVMCLAREDADKQRLLEMTSVSRRLEAGARLLRADNHALAHQAARMSHEPPDERHAALN